MGEFLAGSCVIGFSTGFSRKDSFDSAGTVEEALDKGKSALVLVDADEESAAAYELFFCSDAPLIRKKMSRANKNPSANMTRRKIHFTKNGSSFARIILTLI
jgi:hypothetical protein